MNSPKNIQGAAMNYLLLPFYIVLLLTTSLPLTSWANSKNKEIKIIEIKRTLALSNNKQHNKEFYINAGSNNGLKNMQIIPVVRRKSFFDPLLNKSIGDLWLPVGELKIIHVGEKVSIARIFKVPKRDRLPEVEYNTFMIGDRLQINKARKLKAKKRKSSKAKSAQLKSKVSRGIASYKGKKNNMKLNKEKSFSSHLQKELNEPSAQSKLNNNQYKYSGGGSMSLPTIGR